MELDNRYPLIVYSEDYSPIRRGIQRYRVTLADWHKRPDDLIDEPCWLYSQSNADDGLDPWREIDSIDFTSTEPGGVLIAFELYPAVGPYDAQFQRKYLLQDYVYISQPNYEKLCAHLNGVKPK